jgi:hypothetical protein
MTTSSSFLSIVSMTLVASCTILLLALDLSGPPGTPGTLNGYGYKDIYAWHPALMTLAFTLCFPIAMLSYVVELPSGWLPTKRSRRILHGACNLMGTLFSICGFVLAFTYHEDSRKSPHWVIWRSWNPCCLVQTCAYNLGIHCSSWYLFAMRLWLG